MKKVTKTLAAILCLSIIFSCFAINTFAATSGSMGNNYCTVNLTSNKNATVKIKVWGAAPFGSNSTHIVLTDGNGRWLCEWDLKDCYWGKTIKLGSDHKTYRIYCKYYTSNGTHGIGQASKWKVYSPNNCTIK